MYYAAYLTQWNEKCPYSSCPMKQMDFLCAYCDTILRLCHYMFNTALLTMVVMGTLALAQQTHVAVTG